MNHKCRLVWLAGIPLMALAFGTPTALAQVPEVSGPQFGPRVPAVKVTVDPATQRRGPQGPDLVPEGRREPDTAPGPKRQDRDSAIQLTGAGLGAPIGEVSDAPDSMGAPVVNFAGITSGSGPPDTVGDIGRNHYVQMVNATSYQVWDKAGNALTGVLNFGALWPAGDPCNSNLGDPIVVYDNLADRWNLSQFARNAAQTRFWMCIAISQTPDPTANSWFLYTMETPAAAGLPDYPKFGVWPDGYYMSSYEGSTLGVFVFDRTAMLAGQAATFTKFTIASFGAPGVRDTRVLPADLDGPAPPAGTPNFFVQTVDDQQDPGSNDRLIIFEFAANFATGTFSFTPVTTLTAPGGIAPFDTMTCNRNGGGIRDCIPQPDSAGTVDALSNRPMMQLKYRNFGTHEGMVLNQTIDVSGSIIDLLGFTPTGEVAGIRWYELRRAGGGAWATSQQGTYAPQPNGATTEAQLLHRWMGSAALDRNGNLAIGYSVANDDDTNGQEVYPGIRYAGRRFDDLAGRLPQLERVILNGTASAAGTGGRWGDYSALSVDPVDDCTFYFTTHVVGGATRIAAFRFDTCGTDLRITKTDTPDPVVAGTALRYDLTVTNLGSNPAENVVVIDTLPNGVTHLSNTASCVQAPAGTLTCNLGNIAAGTSRTFTIQVNVRSTAILDGITTLINQAQVSSLTGDTNPANNIAEASTVVIERADVQVIKVCKPDRQAPSGSTAHCEIHVDNLGPSAARAVVLVDDITSNQPFSVTAIVVAAPATCTPGPGSLPTPSVLGHVVTCNLGNILTGGRKTVRVEFSSASAADVNDTATVSAATPDPATSNNVASGSVSFAASADLMVTKSGPLSVDFLSTFTYVLSVDNLGPSSAANVVVTDTLPAGVQYLSASPSVGTFTAINSTITWNLGTVAVADPVRTLQISVRVLPNTTGSLINNARLTSDTADPNGANDLATWTTQVVGTDLWIEKRGIVDAQNPSGALIYLITVHNDPGSAPDDTPTSGFGGPNAAINVVVTDNLPLDSKKMTVQFLTPGCSYDQAQHRVTCTTASLAAGTAVTFQIQVQVKGSVGSLQNVAAVTTATFDPNAGNNTDTVVNVIQGSTGKGPRPK